MKIAVNTRLLIKNKLEGIGWFTYETLKRITVNHPEHKFYFIFDRPYDESFIFSENVEAIVLSPPARHAVLFYIWFELRLPGLLKKIKPDIFLSPDGYLSLSTNVPSITVFHDLAFEHYPKDVPFASRIHYHWFFPKYAVKAKQIATVSEYSKQDIIKQYKIDSAKIDVVYNGANESFVPVNDDDKKFIREKYTGGYQYFVFIGSLNPRKNLINLFKAYDIFREKHGPGIKLLVVGAKMYWRKDIEEAYSALKYKDDIIFSGRLGAEQLGKVLAGALALTYVSYFEGFGIPIVEAFRCDVPVITSEVTSMPEIAGDAALLSNPFDPESIASAMEKMANDENLRLELIRRGRIRREEFTWDKAAARLWNSIMKTYNS